MQSEETEGDKAAENLTLKQNAFAANIPDRRIALVIENSKADITKESETI